MKWPICAPAVKSTSPPSSATSVAIERFGCSRMSSETSAEHHDERQHALLELADLLPFFDASMAHQITTTNRASSDGWKLTGPSPPSGARR